MKLSQFKFKLPEEKIALHPTKYRDESRLLVLHRKTGEIEHKMFKDVLDYFDDKDVFIFNDTKVFPARLYGNITSMTYHYIIVTRAGSMEEDKFHLQVSIFLWCSSVNGSSFKLARS